MRGTHARNAGVTNVVNTQGCRTGGRIDTQGMGGRVLGEKQLGFDPNAPVLDEIRTIASVGVRRVG
eukprot:2961509-Pyramimonas_sp.AAC.1